MFTKLLMRSRLSTNTQTTEYRRGYSVSVCFASFLTLCTRRYGGLLSTRWTLVDVFLTVFGKGLMVWKSSHDHRSLVGTLYGLPSSQLDRLVQN